MDLHADIWEGRVRAGIEAVRGQIPFFNEHFGRVESRWKADHSRVTIADLTISKEVFETLGAHYPQDNFCSEETAYESAVQPLSGEYCWVIDPVDGTNNYALGFPNCCISLALLRNGMPVCGFIYDYSAKALLYGGAEIGLFCEGKAFRGKDAALCSESLLGIQLPLSAETIGRLTPFLSKYRLRCIGSTALNLAHAGQGRLDGAFGRAHIWDIAAGLALIQGGGGEVYFAHPSPFPLKEFHPSMPKITYYGGSPQFCEAVRTLGFESYALPRSR